MQSRKLFKDKVSDYLNMEMKNIWIVITVVICFVLTIGLIITIGNYVGSGYSVVGKAYTPAGNMNYTGEILNYSLTLFTAIVLCGMVYIYLEKTNIKEKE